MPRWCRRPSALTHGGEWCYPGARPEPGDADLYATACREGREEIGLTSVTRLGRLASMPIYTSDFRLEPYVVEIHDKVLTSNPAEVAEVRALPLLDFIRAPHVDGIPFMWDGQRHYSPIYPLGDRYLFGATAHSFTELIEVAAPLVGLKPPSFVESSVTWEEVMTAAR